MREKKQTDIKELAPEVRTWVFDLDNTLYRVPPPNVCRARQADARLRVGVSRRRTGTRPMPSRREYFRKFGLTLRGLMIEHGLDPRVYETHMGGGLDYSDLKPDPRLRDAIAALDGRKVIYTNAFASHARLVLDLIALSEHFGRGLRHRGRRLPAQACDRELPRSVRPVRDRCREGGDGRRHSLQPRACGRDGHDHGLGAYRRRLGPRTRRRDRISIIRLTISRAGSRTSRRHVDSSGPAVIFCLPALL